MKRTAIEGIKNWWAQRADIKKRLAFREQVLTALAQKAVDDRLRFLKKNRRSKYVPHRGKAEMARAIQDSINSKEAS